MQTKRIDLIGVPLDLGVKELGLKLGPDAFREAGLPDVCRSQGVDIRDLGNIQMPAEDSARSTGHHEHLIAACCQTVAELVRRSLDEGRVPVCLGGDHSLAIGSLAGAATSVERLGCVWLDAHPDANTPETSPSGNIHGMPLAIILGHGPSILVDVGSPGATVAYEDVSLLGARDIDPGELDFVRQHGIQMFTVYDVLEQGLAPVVDQVLARCTANTDGLHVSLDLDVLHQDVAPGVGLPSHCGFDIREATYICRRLAEKSRISSIDIIGLNPVRDQDYRTAHLAIELLMNLLGHPFTFSYYQYLKDQSRRH